MTQIESDEPGMRLERSIQAKAAGESFRDKFIELRNLLADELLKDLLKSPFLEAYHREHIDQWLKPVIRDAATDVLLRQLKDVINKKS